MTSIEIPKELKDGLDAVKERDGVRQTEQIRRAIRAWLKDKGIEIEMEGATTKTSRKK